MQDFSVKLQPGYQLVCHIYSVGHVTSTKGEILNAMCSKSLIHVVCQVFFILHRLHARCRFCPLITRKIILLDPPTHLASLLKEVVLVGQEGLIVK